MENIKLKPCPFCGAKARIDVSGGGEGYRVACTRILGCGAKFEWFDEEEAAIDAWNTRIPMEEIIAELEKEYSLANKEKERCVNENILQFDSAKGYATGIGRTIELLKEKEG